MCFYSVLHKILAVTHFSRYSEEQQVALLQPVALLPHSQLITTSGPLDLFIYFIPQIPGYRVLHEESYLVHSSLDVRFEQNRGLEWSTRRAEDHSSNSQFENTRSEDGKLCWHAQTNAVLMASAGRHVMCRH